MATTPRLPTITLADAQRDELKAKLTAEAYPFNGPFAPYIARTAAAVCTVLNERQRTLLAGLPDLGALIIDNAPVDDQSAFGSGQSGSPGSRQSD